MPKVIFFCFQAKQLYLSILPLPKTTTPSRTLVSRKTELSGVQLTDACPWALFTKTDKQVHCYLRCTKVLNKLGFNHTSPLHPEV